MKNIYAALFLLFSSQTGFAQLFNWAYNIGGSSSDKATALTVDVSGNTYVAGTGYGPIKFFSASPASPVIATNAGYVDDIYIAKYTSGGDCAWAKYMGSSTSDYINDIIADASGNIYVTGSFLGDTMDMDPGPGLAVLHNTSGGETIFLAKYDANGNLIWAENIAGNFGTTGKALELDASGNVFLSGVFGGIVDFDPGTGVSSLTSSGAGTDIFVAKYNSNGGYLWALKIGGAPTEPYGGICVDNGGNVYVTGGFYGTVDFDPGANTANLVSAGGPDIFIAKYSASGGYVWAQRYGGTGVDKGSKIVTDGTALYLCGTFASTVTLGSTSLTASGFNNWFVGKTDMTGSFTYAGALAMSNIYSLFRSPGGKLLITGNFNGVLDFNPSAATSFLGASGTSDCFVVQYNSNWGYEWGGTIGGYAMTNGYDVTADNAGHFWVAGTISDWADFNMDPNVQAIVNPDTGIWGATVDGFVASYDGSVLLASGLLSFYALRGEEAVQLNWTMAAGASYARYEIERSTDARHFQVLGTVMQGTDGSLQQDYLYNDQHPVNGTSYYRIAMIGKDGEKDYSHTVKLTGFVKSSTPVFYPNPTDGRAMVKLTSDQQRAAVVRIADMTGRVISEKNILLVPGENLVSADLSATAPGIYKVSISDVYGTLLAAGSITRK